jgi:DNA-binding transcriptional MerR regulator
MEKSMKIGELAEKTGVTTRTIRYYEELGLLKPSDYSDGGLRLYSDFDLLKLKLINNLKELNFSLEEIKSIIHIDCDFVAKRFHKEIIINNLEKQFIETDKNLIRYHEIQNQIELGTTILKSCMACNKKPTFINCSVCSEIPKGDLPLALRAVF